MSIVGLYSVINVISRASTMCIAYALRIVYANSVCSRPLHHKNVNKWCLVYYFDFFQYNVTTSSEINCWHSTYLGFKFSRTHGCCFRRIHITVRRHRTLRLIHRYCNCSKRLGGKSFSGISLILFINLLWCISVRVCISTLLLYCCRHVFVLVVGSTHSTGSSFILFF